MIKKWNRQKTRPLCKIFSFSNCFYVYAEKTNKFDSAQELVVTIEPNKVQYSGRLFIWINNSTFSSAEGFVHILKSRPKTKIVGFDETYGAFGFGQKRAYFRRDYHLHFHSGDP
ncbi:hypothetical protein K0H71_15295 [Bacillus sp. IITD106]|nr:hypothetical protein [Bacillus sp. IITD106]